MDFDWPTYFECAACGSAFPADTVRYDGLGYPECPGCAARTGPLANLDSADTVEPEIAD